jgi:UDP-glucose 4-epimerase
MKYLITGCGGFLGSNLVEALLSLGHEVIGIDNFSSGKTIFLSESLLNSKFKLFVGDIIRDTNVLEECMNGVDIVFHLAAKADIKNNLENPQEIFTQNVVGTVNVLEAMRKKKIKRIAFASTGSVYGETPDIPTKENSFLYPQTSIYSASKSSSEALIQAYCEGYSIQSYIFRFVSMLGKNYHHGHIVDFFNQLKEHPEILYVKGNGNQKKSYIHVYDAIFGMFTGITYGKEKVNIFNVGTDEVYSVKNSIETIFDYMAIRNKPEIKYEDSKRGWVGDNPLIFLDTTKLKTVGGNWKPKYTIEESIADTIKYLSLNNKYLKREEK